MPKAEARDSTRASNEHAPVSDGASHEPSWLSLSDSPGDAGDAAALTFQPEPADLIAKIVKASRIQILRPEPNYLLRVSVDCLRKDHRGLTSMVGSLGLPQAAEVMDRLRYLADMLSGFGAVLDAAAARVEIGMARHAAAIGRGEG